MPDLADAARPQGWSEPGRTTLEIRTGGWRARRPVHVDATAPCRAACPAGEAVAAWIERARAGDLGGAWSLIRQDNPFPAITGRVCAHPCESACNRRGYDGSVAINALERAVGDWGLQHGLPARPAPRRAERVAVVGGGPAGLAAAYHLARLGYRVRLFESRPQLGGLLRYGIPEYRLPRAVLDREIQLALLAGVEVITGRRLGESLSWASAAEHEMVFLATGAQRPLALGVRGDGARGVIDGVQFLRAVAIARPPAPGRHVVVVGGGSTAMDVARSAIRLGAASVAVLALEGRDDMPALPEEVSQAEEEGIVIRNGTGVAEVLEDGGRVTGVIVAGGRVERDPDGSIRARLDGTRQVVDCDAVLVAIGQRPDLSGLPPDVATPGGLVATDHQGATSAPGVFAGGDLASRERTVTHAIGAGTRAARAIHAALSGEVEASTPTAPAGTSPRPGHVVTLAEVTLAHFARLPRATRPGRARGGTVGSFAEVVRGITPEEAWTESRRCFTCGRCTGCDNCFLFCPDMAVSRLPGGGYAIDLDHCKGCGLCVEECPRGALAMAGER